MKKIIFAFLLGILTIPIFAFGLGKEGGGGKGVVCRNPDNSIRSVELLDLWEARKIYGETPLANNESLEKQITNNIDRLKYSVQLAADLQVFTGNVTYSESDYFATRLQYVTNFFVKSSPYVQRLHNVNLSPTNDSFEPAQPAGGCTIEQLVYYIDSASMPHILVNQDLVDLMDRTNQAALYLHEAFYLYMRGYSDNLFFQTYKEPDSIRVRRAIGYAFAGHAFPSLVALIGKKYVVCEGGGFNSTEPSRLYVYKDASGKSLAINTQTFGKPAIGFFPDAVDNVVTWTLVTRHEACGEPDPQSIRGGVGFTNAVGGPVDFQMMSWIVPTCYQGHTSLYLASDTRTGAANKSQQLTCRVVELP
jgi:hypothetical protein